jgi:hypothetical protein
MTLPSDIDPECIPLCNAINRVPGLSTIESCCGHAKDEFDIWFKATKLNSLYVVARCIDIRYTTVKGWVCEVVDRDHCDDPVRFWLHSSCISRGLVGVGKVLIYQEANTIAKDINAFMDNKKFVKMFGIK